jgi:hypothetical protein
MAAGSTYVPITNYTVSGTSTTLITFNSFSGYSDLVMRIQGTSTGNARLRFNSDSGSNYGWTILTGDGSTASSVRTNSDTSAITSYYGGNGIVTANIMNYSDTSKYKMVLSRAGASGGGTDLVIGRWNNSSAITTITVQVNTAGSGTFSDGTNITIWGILNA